MYLKQTFVFVFCAAPAQVRPRQFLERSYPRFPSCLFRPFNFSLIDAVFHETRYVPDGRRSVRNPFCRRRLVECGVLPSHIRPRFAVVGFRIVKSIFLPVDCSISIACLVVSCRAEPFRTSSHGNYFALRTPDFFCSPSDPFEISRREEQNGAIYLANLSSRPLFAVRLVRRKLRWFIRPLVEKNRGILPQTASKRNGFSHTTEHVQDLPSS